MSGEAGGLLIIPLALFAMPVIIGGLAVAGVAAATVKAGSAAVEYEQEQRRRREEIRRSGVANNIGNFRTIMHNSMAEQTRLNIETSSQMMSQLEHQRNEMQRLAKDYDPQQYQQYINQLKQSQAATMQTIHRTQENFNVMYRNRIAESMSTVTAQINSQYSMYIDELQALQANLVAKAKRAESIASSYIEEARVLLVSLADDFDGRKFSGRQLASLESQLNQAINQFNSQHYESAIASAKDVAINTLEEIYEADEKKQEWENYQKLALVLSDEVLTYIESQGIITSEVKDYAEKATGEKLEDEIVGISVADYTAKNQRGQNQYDYLLARIKQIHSALRQPDAANMTTEQLKEYVEFLNNELYPAISSCISKGIINMNNAFSRQNISEEIIDFFEEHNFMYNGYAYEDDCHDKALHIGLENEATGEELIVTLAPELVGNGEIQTRVDIKQIKGDEANEERKAYYRQCVEEVVRGNNPYAQISLKCNAATRGKLSTDTETKKKLQQ